MVGKQGKQDRDERTGARIDGKRAVYAGMIGALVMSVVMMLGRIGGVPARLELVLGSLVTGQVGFGSVMLGLFMHMILGGIAGVLYALFLVRVLQRTDWLGGLYIGAGHGLVAGFLLAALPAVHPLIPWDPLVSKVVPALGLFMHRLGPAGPVLFVASHLAFGAVVGAIYRNPGLARMPEPQRET